MLSSIVSDSTLSLYLISFLAMLAIQEKLDLCKGLSNQEKLDLCKGLSNQKLFLIMIFRKLNLSLRRIQYGHDSPPV